MTTAPVRDIAADGAAEERASPGPCRPAPAVHRRAPQVARRPLAAALILPLAVAVVAFHKPTWTPVLDLAQTELRVRDVGTAHTPLIGLPGRIGTGAAAGEPSPAR